MTSAFSEQLATNFLPKSTKSEKRAGLLQTGCRIDGFGSVSVLKSILKLLEIISFLLLMFSVVNSDLVFYKLPVSVLNRKCPVWHIR